MANIVEFRCKKEEIMNYIGISFLALVPALLLCWYVYSKDRVEKEPFGLLLLLFAAGAVLYLPAILAENAIIGLFDKAFSADIEYSLTGVATFLSSGAKLKHSLLCGVVAVAVIEESAKWLVLYLITFKNKNFSHLFDGVVYAVFVSLGFAAAENVRFAIMDGWDTFIIRSVTSVPAHMIFGVLMGVAYTAWHMWLLAKKKEKILECEGVIKIEKTVKSGHWLVASVALPIAVHGFYSFAHFFDSETVTAIYYAVILVIFAVSFVYLRWLSAVDRVDDEVAFGLLGAKYPALKNKEDTTLDDLEAMERGDE